MLPGDYIKKTMHHRTLKGCGLQGCLFFGCSRTPHLERCDFKRSRHHKEEYSFREVAQTLKISEKSAWLFTIGREKGFSTNSEYESSLLDKRGYGFKSITEYHDFLDSEKTLREENRVLASLIVSNRKSMGKSQSWLSERTGVSRQMISLYESGKSIPSYEHLHLLLSVLKVKKIPKSLEEIV